MNREPANLAQLLLAAAEPRPDRAALHFREPGAEAFESLNWTQLVQQTAGLADVLLELGVRPSDRVGQFSQNRREWLLLDLACHWVGAVHVAMHAPHTGPQVAFQIQDSECGLVFISNAQQADKLRQAEPLLPNRLNLFAWDHDCGTFRGRPIPTMDIQQSHPENLSSLARFEGFNSAPESLATILYTSGTTGEPKGVMLSHRNLIHNAQCVGTAFNMTEHDHKLCWLPLSHIFARTCDLYAWIAHANQLTLAESRDTVLRDCQQAHPTIISCVPYFLQKLRMHLQSTPNDVSAALSSELGGNVRALASGGAPLAMETADWFAAHGIPVLQGYGLSETSPVISASTPDRFRSGSVGPLIQDVEIAFTEDGELLTRGPHVMLGYWRNPQATAEVLQNGWFATGDFGRMDEDGFLWITGRKKEIIALSSGKKVAPLAIENAMGQSPFIAQVMVLGDNQNFLAALIAPDHAQLKTALSQEACDYQPRGAPVLEVGSSPSPEVRLLRSEINRMLLSFAPWEQVGKFALLPRPFSLELGEMTPKLSLCRGKILENYADLVAALYAK